MGSRVHFKSELGAVAIDLRDGEAVRSATERMAPDFEQFLVESMVQPVVCELIVGVNRDPTFGLTLLIGAGGTLVELVDDCVSLLLPVQRNDIRTAIATLKVHDLIGGHRGQAAGDLEAVIDSIEAIARYADLHKHSLIELDVNPLCVLTDSAVAVDAFIRKS